jgi:hypothetical protein
MDPLKRAAIQARCIVDMHKQEFFLTDGNLDVTSTLLDPEPNKHTLLQGASRTPGSRARISLI